MQKLLLRALAVIFGLSTFVQLIMAITEKSPAATVSALVTAAITFGLWRLSSRADRADSKAGDKNNQLADEAAAYFDHVNSVGKFPESPTDRIISRQDCPVLAACNAKLLEVTSDQARQYLGTRVKLAGLPIYLGQSSSAARTAVREAAQGELAITPKSLIFDGQHRSADVDLDKITALDIAFDAITVSVRGRQKPLIFIVPNGLLWGMLIRNLIQIPVHGRQLPPGTQLTIR
ncbi:MAG: hypothetical protein WC681_04020 [Sterolibacterium sp.]